MALFDGSTQKKEFFLVLRKLDHRIQNCLH
jgi:hypothetical protein